MPAVEFGNNVATIYQGQLSAGDVHTIYQTGNPNHTLLEFDRRRDMLIFRHGRLVHAEQAVDDLLFPKKHRIDVDFEIDAEPPATSVAIYSFFDMADSVRATHPQPRPDLEVARSFMGDTAMVVALEIGSGRYDPVVNREGKTRNSIYAVVNIPDAELEALQTEIWTPYRNDLVMGLRRSGDRKAIEERIALAQAELDELNEVPDNPTRDRLLSALVPASLGSPSSPEL